MADLIRQQSHPQHPLSNVLHDPEMLIKLLNEGISSICRATYQNHKPHRGIYNLDVAEYGWPGMNEGNLVCTSVWFDEKEGLVTQDLVAPAVPVRASYVKGEWAGYGEGNAEIAGPRQLRTTDKNGLLRETQRMERFKKPFVVSEFVRGDGLYPSKHSLTFTFDSSEDHSSSLYKATRPSQVHYMIKREIITRKDDLGYTFVHHDQFSLYLVLRDHSYQAHPRLHGEVAHVLASNA